MQTKILELISSGQEQNLRLAASFVAEWGLKIPESDLVGALDKGMELIVTPKYYEGDYFELHFGYKFLGTLLLGAHFNVYGKSEFDIVKLIIWQDWYDIDDELVQGKFKNIGNMFNEENLKARKLEKYYSKYADANRAYALAEWEKMVDEYKALKV